MTPRMVSGKSKPQPPTAEAALLLSEHAKSEAVAQLARLTRGMPQAYVYAGRTSERGFGHFLEVHVRFSDEKTAIEYETFMLGLGYLRKKRSPELSREYRLAGLSEIERRRQQLGLLTAELIRLQLWLARPPEKE